MPEPIIYILAAIGAVKAAELLFYFVKHKDWIMLIVFVATFIILYFAVKQTYNI